MKQLLVGVLVLIGATATAQSLDYISIRKKNGQVVKNIYSGSSILLQTTDGHYYSGPIKSIRNDSLTITLYDIRFYRTNFGSVVRDTISRTDLPLYYKDIQRVQLTVRKSFLKRVAGPLLIIGGSGYMALNLLNGALFDLPITDTKNLRTLATAGGAVGLGLLLQKIFKSDGFTSRKHQVVYVDL